MTQPAIRSAAAKCARGFARVEPSLCVARHGVQGSTTPRLRATGSSGHGLLRPAALSTKAIKLTGDMPSQDQLQQPTTQLDGSKLNMRMRSLGKLPPLPPLTPYENYKANAGMGSYSRIRRDIRLPSLKPDTPWGLAVYRTCYDDEAAWQEWCAEFEDLTTPSPPDFPEREDGIEEIYERHQAVIMDDKTQLDGAGRARIRDHFDQWARSELERNQAEQPVTDERRKLIFEPSDDGWLAGHIEQCGARYNVFGVVDDVCLESVRRGRPGPLLMLVRRDWKPMSEEEVIAQHGGVHPDWEDGVMVDHTEGWAGWIYTEVAEYKEHYNAVSDLDEWDDELRFQSASNIYCIGMGLERSPGFWREEMAAKTSGVALPAGGKASSKQ